MAKRNMSTQEHKIYNAILEQHKWDDNQSDTNKYTVKAVKNKLCNVNLSMLMVNTMTIKHIR